MSSRQYKTFGINLKSYNLGDSDKIIVIFSREYGKIKAVAKGCRKPKSKFSGRLEVFGYNNLLISKGKKDLDFLSQVETAENLQHIRNSYENIEAGLYFLWVIDRATVDGQPNPALFDLLLSCLQALAHRQKPLINIKQFFQQELLRCEGIMAEGEFSEAAFDKKFFEYAG